MHIVYGPEMVARLLQHTSPSAYKPQALLEYLLQRGYTMQVHPPQALSREDLSLAHHPEYVQEILECQVSNGFGNRDPDVAASLPYTSGSLYVAALLALEHGLAAAFCSGFHHAHYDRGGGFCTFNGLVASARRLHQEGRVQRLMILDLDFHYGDGTDEILGRFQSDWIRHETFGSDFHHPRQGEDYLRKLGQVLESLPEQPVDLILYQAGADVHVDDPLGGVLTTQQMRTRDEMVFEATHRLRIPIAWNLAGGYQRDEQGSILPVLQLHEQTFRAASQVYNPDQTLPGLSAPSEFPQECLYSLWQKSQ